MSRSRRKTPIMPTTSCRSEKPDKKQWHQRWRRRERALLASSKPDQLQAFLPTLARQVSNPWDMGKDGRNYWPKSARERAAQRQALKRGRNPQEQAALRKRLLHKWSGK